MSDSPQKIRFSYERTDTKQFHEFIFSSWDAALEFARLADKSPETRLLNLSLLKASDSSTISSNS